MEPRLLQAASSVLTVVMPSSIAAVAAQISASMTPAASNALKEDDRLVLLAKAAEAAGRFDDMKQYMKERAGMSPLSPEERDLLYVSFKGAYAKGRHAAEVAEAAKSSEEAVDNPALAALAEAYELKAKAELADLCEEAVGMLGKVLPKAKAGEPKAFFLKMQGDFYRYIWAFAKGDKPKKQAARNARQAYCDGIEEASKHLLVAHPVSLAIMLNFAVLQSEVFGDTQGAISTARSALEEASVDLDSLTADVSRDVNGFIRSLQENVSVWEAALAGAANSPLLKDRHTF